MLLANQRKPQQMRHATSRILAAWAVAALAGAALSGCVAKAVVGVVTAPVRMGSKAVDLATTSQSEADEKRGRDMRRSEERLGQLERNHNRHARQCSQGSDHACALAEAERAQLDANYPAAPDRR